MTSGPNIARDERKRKKIEITLSPEARDALEDLAEEFYDGSRSACVEDFLLHGEIPGGRLRGPDDVEAKKPPPKKRPAVR